MTESTDPPPPCARAPLPLRSSSVSGPPPRTCCLQGRPPVGARILRPWPPACSRSRAAPSRARLWGSTDAFTAAAGSVFYRGFFFSSFDLLIFCYFRRPGFTWLASLPFLELVIISWHSSNPAVCFAFPSQFMQKSLSLTCHFAIGRTCMTFMSSHIQSSFARFGTNICIMSASCCSVL